MAAARPATRFSVAPEAQGVDDPGSSGNARGHAPDPGARLLLRRFTGTEEISRLHAWEVDVVSPDPSVDAQRLLGRHGTVLVGAGAEAVGPRHLDGLITRFGMREGPVEVVGARTADSGPFAVAVPLYPYRLLLRPWLWLATRQGGVRMFEGLSIPAIVAQVLAPYGHPVSLDRLTRHHPPRAWTLQGGETDFDFIARLCEDAGLHWFFEHQAGGHRLVFVDGGPGSHRPLPGGEVVSFMAPSATDGGSGSRWRVPPGTPPRVGQVGGQGRHPTPHVDYWAMGREAEPDARHHFSPTRTGRRGGMEVGAAQRMGADASGMPPRWQAPLRFNAHLDQHRIAPGHTIALQGHPQPAQNQVYLVVAVDYHLEEGPASVGPALDAGHAVDGLARQEVGATAAAGASPPPSSVQRFATEVHPLSAPFRPQRIAPRPRALGMQVGVVMAVDDGDDDGVQAGGGVGATSSTGPRRVRLNLHAAGGHSAGAYLSGWVPVPLGLGGRRLCEGEAVLVDFLYGQLERPVLLGRAAMEDAGVV